MLECPVQRHKSKAGALVDFRRFVFICPRLLLVDERRQRFVGKLCAVKCRSTFGPLLHSAFTSEQRTFVKIHTNCNNKQNFLCWVSQAAHFPRFSFLRSTSQNSSPFSWIPKLHKQMIYQTKKPNATKDPLWSNRLQTKEHNQRVVVRIEGICWLAPPMSNALCRTSLLDCKFLALSRSVSVHSFQDQQTTPEVSTGVSYW